MICRFKNFYCCSNLTWRKLKLTTPDNNVSKFSRRKIIIQFPFILFPLRDKINKKNFHKRFSLFQRVFIRDCLHDICPLLRGLLHPEDRDRSVSVGSGLLHNDLAHIIQKSSLRTRPGSKLTATSGSLPRKTCWPASTGRSCTTRSAEAALG